MRAGHVGSRFGGCGPPASLSFVFGPLYAHDSIPNRAFDRSPPGRRLELATQVRGVAQRVDSSLEHTLGSNPAPKTT